MSRNRVDAGLEKGRAPSARKRSARRSVQQPAITGAERGPDSNGLAERVATMPTSPLLEDIPTALIESLRYLISRFQLGDHSEFPARLGVTSALHGEGVTTISRSLAAIVANDLGVETCWIDLSWRVARGGGDVPGPPGLADVLAGRLELHKVLRSTGDSRLTLLHSGTVGPGQREAFSRSPLLGDVIDQLAMQFPTVILDTPPVLAGSAGIGQLRHAESYMLVVRHGVTSVQQVRAATDQLRAIPSLGVILNQYSSNIPKRLTHFFVP